MSERIQRLYNLISEPEVLAENAIPILPGKIIVDAKKLKRIIETFQML